MGSTVPSSVRQVGLSVLQFTARAAVVGGLEDALSGPGPGHGGRGGPRRGLSRHSPHQELRQE